MTQPAWITEFPESIRHRCARCGAWVVWIIMHKVAGYLMELEPSLKGGHIVGGKRMQFHMNCQKEVGP